MNTFSELHPIVGIQGVARLLGVSRQQADELSRQGDFPEPDAVLEQGVRVWKTSAIEKWAKQTGRLSK
jgi:predicted DNA-binding transcriptional regulator AlpA